MQLVRFAAIGVAVAAAYVLMFLGFRAAGLAPMAANALAFLLAVVLQYVGQGAFTFERSLKDRGQALRFVVMISLGLATATVITAGLGPALGLADWLAAAIVAFVLPVQNYLLMSIWVFTGPRKEAPQ